MCCVVATVCHRFCFLFYVSQYLIYLFAVLYANTCWIEVIPAYPWLPHADFRSVFLGCHAFIFEQHFFAFFFNLYICVFLFLSAYSGNNSVNTGALCKLLPRTTELVRHRKCSLINMLTTDLSQMERICLRQLLLILFA